VPSCKSRTYILPTPPRQVARSGDTRHAQVLFFLLGRVPFFLFPSRLMFLFSPCLLGWIPSPRLNRYLVRVSFFPRTRIAYSFARSLFPFGRTDFSFPYFSRATFLPILRFRSTLPPPPFPPDHLGELPQLSFLFSHCQTKWRLFPGLLPPAKSSF